MNRPNVILLTIDTLRADMLGCYGDCVPLAPNIDRLATTGIRFEQAITGGSWTQAAFPVLLTSTYASMYGGCLGPLSPERPSPVETLAAHGYATAGFSTSPLLSRAYDYDRGFDRFVDLAPDESDPALRHIKGGERLLRQPLTHYVSKLFGKSLRPPRIYVSAADVTDHACEWIEQVDAPFFVWAHYMDVHWPYHREETLTYPHDIAQAWRDLAHLHAANWHGKTTTVTQRERYLRLYRQAVQHVDAEIGRLLATLDALGQGTNTIVVLVADHGEEFMERGRWGHFENNLHDEIIRVPLIIRLPDQSTGQVVSRQVRTLDVMPTILDLCECPPPETMEGTSLKPLWTEASVSYEGDVALSEMWRNDWHIVAVRTESYKYIWDNRRPKRPRLFDLRIDPEEQHDVHARSPELVRRFQYHVDAHLERVAETAPTLQASEPEHVDEVVRRLRDLGYVE